MLPHPRPLNHANLALLVLAIGVGGQAHAARFDASMSVSPSLTYTDNICASESNKKSDIVGTATPSGRLSVKGSRANLNLSGHMQFNSLTDSQLNKRGCGGSEDSNLKRRQYKPKLRANGAVEVIRNGGLNVRFSARADQNRVNSQLAGDEDPFDRDGNGNNYLRYSVMPSHSRRIQGVGNLTLRYGYDEVINDKNKANDSVREQFNINLKGEKSSRINWGLSARQSEVTYENNSNFAFQRRSTKLESARLNLGYQFGRRFAINGSAGVESNNLPKNRYNDDGLTWQLNLRWTPSRRTSVTVGSGDRFFGKTPRINIRYKRKRSAFSLNYNKKITYDRDIRTSDEGLLTDFGDNTSLLSRSPIIDERVSLGYNWQGSSASVSVNGSVSEQTRTNDGAKGNFKNIGVTFSPRVSSNFNLAFLVNYSDNEPRQRRVLDVLPDNSTQVWSTSVSVGKPINDRMSSSLTYQFIDRTSAQDLGDYQENRIVATLSISL